ncbi:MULTISPECIES: response regulator transcription factor [unclassified Nocardioides]|uniref:response regulator n=1 Tax=unclassified Nocardioides TaxID=2615069 RepID=UPI0009EB35C3|nr:MULTISPECIES: response regulator transcription factor [unclassified Nocardioides]
MIRVVLADDHELIRRGLAAVLSEQPDITVCGVAETGEGAVSQAREQSPDVVLLDLSMPGEGGLAAAAEILEEHLAAHAMIFTGHTAPELIRAAFAIGATGFVLKGTDAGEVVAAVRAVHRGEVWLSPEDAGVLAAELAVTAPVIPLRPRGSGRRRRARWVRFPRS